MIKEIKLLLPPIKAREIEVTFKHLLIILSARTEPRFLKTQATVTTTANSFC